ncbi:MAG: 30S ribosomal protein S6 [Gammaproteobacteria bacterium]|nr:30S ribosomal protein S6 [Gammaproteobacteria bacterium]
MRDYELVVIFHPALGEDAIQQKMDRFHGLVSGGDAEIRVVDHWGGRKLAYPIQKQTSGHYVVTQFLGDPASLPELERIMKLDEGVLRYLLVVNEGEPSSGLSMVAEAPPASRAPEESRGDDNAEGEEKGGEEEAEVRTSPPEFSGGRGHRRRIEGPPITILNYKDVATLSRFVTEQGKLLPRRTTRVAAGFQRKLGRAVKRARYLALLPYVRRHEG